MDATSLEEALATLARLAEVGDSLRIDTRKAFFGLPPGLIEGAAETPASGTPKDARLQLAEARYRVLIEQIPVVTFLASLVGGGGNEIYVSPQIESLLGFTQEEWVSDPVLWYEQVHPDDRDSLSRDFASMCITGEPFRGVIRVFTRGRVLRWVQMEARFVCDEQGNPLFLQGAGFDVTDQVQAQETRDRLVREQVAREEADRERRRLLDVFTTLPAAIAVLAGPNHVLEYVNPVAQELGGTSTIVGQQWARALPQFGPETTNLLDTVRVTGERAVLAQQRFKASRSRDRFFNIICQPLSDGRSADPSLLVHAVEVTEEVLARRQVEDALRLRDEALAELQKTIKMREQFLSAAAHDLKTPLATTRGWAQLLNKRAAIEVPDKAWLHQGTQAIENGAYRMTMLVEEFLDLARMQTGAEVTLERRQTDLLELARAAVKDHAEQTDRHELQIETDEDSLVGSWDEARIRRVVNNLLDNAIKYSPQGGDVRIRLQRGPGDFATLQIEDQGVGIPAVDLPRIFGQFHRGSNVLGRISGTGVGLHASQHIINLHGGTIEVVSKEGRGSTFTVRLPLVGLD